MKKDQTTVLIIIPVWQQFYSVRKHFITALRGRFFHCISKPAAGSGMDGFRKTLKNEGVSELAATLITNSRGSGQVYNYQLGE